MLNARRLAAICYFSVLFLPLLIPIVIFLITEDTAVKFHAKRSFISHIIPTALLIISSIIFSLSMFSVEGSFLKLFNPTHPFWHVTPLLLSFLYIALFAGVFIWNMYWGIKLLKAAYQQDAQFK